MANTTYSSTRLHHTIRNTTSKLIASGTNDYWNYTGQIVGATCTTVTIGGATYFKITSPPGTKFVYKETISERKYPYESSYYVSFWEVVEDKYSNLALYYGKDADGVLYLSNEQSTQTPTKMIVSAVVTVDASISDIKFLGDTFYPLVGGLETTWVRPFFKFTADSKVKTLDFSNFDLDSLVLETSESNPGFLTDANQMLGGKVDFILPANTDIEKMLKISDDTPNYLLQINSLPVGTTFDEILEYCLANKTYGGELDCVPMMCGFLGNGVFDTRMSVVPEYPAPQELFDHETDMTKHWNNTNENGWFLAAPSTGQWYRKVSGTWQEGTLYKKISGEWKVQEE